MKRVNIFLVVFCVPLTLVTAFDLGLDPIKTAKRQGASKIPPCRLCKTYVDSFEKNMERTARGKHESGDTAWEEQNMKIYQKSEVRLVEILDKICQDVSSSEDQCHAYAEEVEHVVEDWFLNKQDEVPSLHSFLCIDSMKVCCPPNRFGAQCLPCTDCNGNGNCKGNGTRKGNGKCSCHAGYKGDNCNECALQYYESFRDDTKLLCSECHVACEKNTGCNGAGPQGCRVCASGWVMNAESGGCTDVDECALDSHKCSENQFCVNRDGSHDCLECDRACLGCTGDGPDLCVKCADGYELRDGMCTDQSEDYDDDSEKTDVTENEEVKVEGSTDDKQNKDEL